ncbi:hypothetical protein [Nonomuraea sp. NPDC005650]
MTTKTLRRPAVSWSRIAAFLAVTFGAVDAAQGVDRPGLSWVLAA